MWVLALNEERILNCCQSIASFDCWTVHLPPLPPVSRDVRTAFWHVFAIPAQDVDQGGSSRVETDPRWTSWGGITGGRNRVRSDTDRLGHERSRARHPRHLPPTIIKHMEALSRSLKAPERATENENENPGATVAMITNVSDWIEEKSNVLCCGR